MSSRGSIICAAFTIIVLGLVWSGLSWSCPRASGDSEALDCSLWSSLGSSLLAVPLFAFVCLMVGYMCDCRVSKLSALLGSQDLSESSYLMATSSGDCAAVVPVVAFDNEAANKQMQRVIFGWLLGNQLELQSSKGPAIKVCLEVSSRLSINKIRRAFDRVKKLKPPLVLWLLPFKDGEGDTGVLKALKRHFAESRMQDGVRHGVFHWSPEFQDQDGATFSAIKEAYEHVDFVFQFGYSDERFARLDREKWLPFPLGPALWRGWETPLMVPPPSKRRLLAGYRGSSNTHPDVHELQEAVNRLSPEIKETIVVESRGPWTFSDSNHDQERYRQLLLDSKYALSPAGNNPNCYRVLEAVESGSTPIIVVPGPSGCYENWATLYGIPCRGATSYPWIPSAPFQVLRTWSELATIAAALPTKAEEDANGSGLLCHSLSGWYGEWRQAFKNQVVHCVEKSLSGAVSL